ncbi:MAG: MazG family protein [Lachnoclostridium edouardi]|uniref:MazG family protein n=1 Tax=Lachnoclostridium edouardi TaxID=1926283 RepID=UPI0026DDAC16|nr:MazG family protein [Lachnoclostridium edouardi]MDO4277905.1 MazG family protein [Lachnoclostridium edouardi]
MYTFEDLIQIVEKLRDKDQGCPWDKEQTHESMKKCLTDECQEVLWAIDNRDMENLCEELGDLLFQVMIHSQIGKEENEFTIADVIDGICRKMVYRHPHVFGDVKVSSTAESNELWKILKNNEKGKKP